MRADQLLVQRGLAPTRSAAQRLIERGAVRWRALYPPHEWAVPRKSGEDLPEAIEIEITDDAELRFVSRGGLKLDGALVQRGAARVVGLDVGHGQLAEKLRGDARITALEGVNARHLDAAALPVQSFDLIVGDLSFISLSLVLPALAPLLGGTLLMLVKPQFELQPADIGKGGLVKDPAAYARVEARLREACAALRLKVVDWFDSPIAGGDGNREFFLQAHHE